jgi:uncharacterized protein
MERYFMIELQPTVCDGKMMKVLFTVALAWLEQNTPMINKLNVFPVPDGDTGTNMLHTLQSAVNALPQETDVHVGRTGDTLARGALRGARGNSGTILSMLLRGFANALNNSDYMDAPMFVQACRSASITPMPLCLV